MIDGDFHFICYLGSSKLLPACLKWQCWFYFPGSSLLYRKESMKERQRQKTKGLFCQARDMFLGLLHNPPRKYPGPIPMIHGTLTLCEIADDGDPQEQIEPELLKQQIEAKKVAVKKLLSGQSVEFDFGKRLRVLGWPLIKLGYV